MRPLMSTRMSARSFSTIYAESNVDKNFGQIIFDELIRPLMSTRMSERYFRRFNAKSNVDKNVGQIIFDDSMGHRMWQPAAFFLFNRTSHSGGSERKAEKLSNETKFDFTKSHSNKIELEIVKLNSI